MNKTQKHQTHTQTNKPKLKQQQQKKVKQISEVYPDFQLNRC